MRATRRPRATSAWLLVAGLTALACGSAERPEVRLERADQALEEARDDLSKARERRDAAVRELAEARKALRHAERSVLSAEERLARRSTDVAIFRAVQAALLDEEALRQDPVMARVEDARVTLEGEVSSPEQRDRAVEIARATAGVEAVRDAIHVEAEASAGGG